MKQYQNDLKQYQNDLEIVDNFIFDPTPNSLFFIKHGIMLSTEHALSLLLCCQLSTLHHFCIRYARPLYLLSHRWDIHQLWKSSLLCWPWINACLKRSISFIFWNCIHDYAFHVHILENMHGKKLFYSPYEKDLHFPNVTHLVIVIQCTKMCKF